jgi:sulfur relay (sulfurtransferase) DsrC/TusE family protein
MKITADRIRNKISLFSIYKLVGAAPLDYALRCAGVPMFNEPGHSRPG